MNQAIKASLKPGFRIFFIIILGFFLMSKHSCAQPVFGTPLVTNATCGYNSGSILAPVSGGTQPYTYTLNGVAQASNYFVGLPANSYTIVVRDAANATATLALTITNAGDHPTPTATVTPPTGCDQVDGIINVAATGGNAPYTFSVAGATTVTPTRFSASNGLYTVLVRGANGCYGSVQVNLNRACTSPGVQSITTVPACGPGTVTATPAAGAALPFTYSLNGTDGYPISTNTITNVAPGTHKLYAKDRNGNIFIYNFTLSQACVVTLPLTTSATPAVCANNDGTITINVTANGVAPIFYSVVGRPFQQSNVITNLGPGYYTVQAKDAAGHVGQATLVQVPGNCPTLNVTTTPTSCSGNTGTVTVVGTGVAPITYSLAGPVNRPAQAGTAFTNLPAGAYTVTSTDGNGTVITASATVSTVPGPALDPPNVTPTGCTVNNGTVSATETGGLAPFTYQVDNGATNSTGNFGALGAGVHNIRVTDANGCSDVQDFTIVATTPPTLTLTPVPAGCSVGNGSITAVAAGGTGDYSYQLGTAAPNNTGLFPNLPAGTYTVTVTDANGCTSQQTATVTTAAGPVFPPATVTPSSCAGNDGVISAAATGGRPPFSYSLDNGPAQSTGTFTAVSAGDHILVVTDANGCVISQSITVNLNNTVLVSAGTTTNVCAGQSVPLQGTSNAPATWSPATGLSDPNILTPRAAPAQSTKYYLTGKSGVCTSVDSVIINVFALPLANAGSDTTICAGDNATLNGSGGVSFTWTPSSFLDNDHSRQPVVLNPVQTMVYQLSVTDDNGCTSALPDAVTVTVSPLPVVSAGRDTSVLTGVPFQLIASDVNGSGFIRYSWTPGIGLDNPDSPNPNATLTKGETLTVTARTAAGCSAQDDITIKVFDRADLYVSNAFTPNNDGINDVLHVNPIGMKEFHYFRVYNRKGQLVFSTSDAGAGWDGRINGQAPSTGGYVWTAEGIDNNGKLTQRQGNVVLIR